MELTTDHKRLEQQWTALKSTEPGLKIRDAADRLAVSEATLLSLLLGRGVRRLQGEPAAFLSQLKGLGQMMALTRNQAAVLECHSEYSSLDVKGNVGLMTGSIDMRIDFSHWVYAFTEEKTHAGRQLRSVQWFDAAGAAVHKVYLDNDEHLDEWTALVNASLHEDQTSVVIGTPKTKGIQHKAGDPAVLLAAWERLADPHHFHGMLRKSGFGRQEAYAAAEGRFTRRVEASTLYKALTAAADSVPIMLFVGNPGSLLIYTGPVSKIRPLGSWVNVLDPLVDLHVDTQLISSAWIVEKPSPEGLVTSLEVLDEHGELIIQVFGKRKPGEPELEAWTALAATL